MTFGGDSDWKRQSLLLCAAFESLHCTSVPRPPPRSFPFLIFFSLHNGRSVQPWMFRLLQDTDQLKSREKGDGDGVSIWDCQTRRNDKVHRWEQAEPRGAFHQLGVRPSGATCSQLVRSFALVITERVVAAAGIELSTPQHHATCCSSPLSKGIRFSWHFTTSVMKPRTGIDGNGTRTRRPWCCWNNRNGSNYLLWTDGAIDEGFEMKKRWICVSFFSSTHLFLFSRWQLEKWSGNENQHKALDKNRTLSQSYFPAAL